MAPHARTRGARTDQPAVRERILSAFSTRAKRDGIRAVMMGELARELRMSASTLYKHFASKQALTEACVERWALELAAAEAAEPDPRAKRDPFEQFMHWLSVWADANASLSPAFARDLRTDYPAAHGRFREVIAERRRRGAALLRPALRDDIDQRVALGILGLLLDEVLKPDFADRLRISRHEAMRSAVAIWAGGALKRGGKLSMLTDMPGKGRAP